MRQLFLTGYPDYAALILRLTLGLIFFPHASQKMLGLFGGQGFTPSMNFFTSVIKLPRPLAFLVIVLEFFCSIAVIAGLASWFCAIVFIIIMIGAIKTMYYQNGFFMNWFGKQKGEGYEYHLLVIGMSIALLLTGSGIFSVDYLIY